MSTTAQPTELYEQLNSWKEEVREVKEEVTLMRERLEQIALSKAPKEVLSQVEHFENRLLRQREVADEMFHDIKQSAKKHSDIPAQVHHDDRPVHDYPALQSRMETFQQLYMQLKSEFNHFIASLG